jgi:peptide/nickel transport system substrate-binding protein
MRTRYLVGTLILVLSLVLTACTPASAPAPAEQPAPAETPAAAAPAEAVHEAPALHELVLEGKLPPLEERIPKEPYVIEPFSEIGKYGGTWHRFDTSTNGSHLVMAMYGHSPIHWVRDGLDKRGGLAKGWDSNADKTEWTLYFREGTRWSDGEPFTVDDILFWWNDMALNPDYPESPPDWMISGGKTAELTKIDDYTIKFTFAAPAPLFVDRLAMWPNSGVPDNSELFVVPAHYLKQFHPKYSSDYSDYTTFSEKVLWQNNPDRPVLNPWMPVSYEPGVRMVLERNPYYYAVDTAGNQLPYIDRIEMSFVEDLEVSKLKVIGGEQEICGRPCKYQPLSELTVFRDAESTVGLKTYLWDGGSGTGSLVYPNWTHRDPEKRALYHDKNFRRALSHAIDRDKIQKAVYFGTGFPTTGTMSPKAIEYNATEEGRNLFAQWRDLAVTYDVDAANSMLDKAGAVDQDGDGWRDLPSGAALELRIDVTTGAMQGEHGLVLQIIKENWEAVGLKTIINPVPDEQMNVLQDSNELDIRGGWEVGDGPNHLVYPQWVVPIGSRRWAPLYGAWYATLGTDKEGTELDKAPEDRNPPREEPEPGDPVLKLWDLYNKAKIEPDDAKREELVFDIMRVHIEEGPFFIGTVANLPTIVAFLDTVGNVPTKEQLGTGGFTNPWIMVYFGAVFPEQMYYKNQ